MIFLLDLIYAIVVLLLSPFLLWRIIFRNRYRRGWPHRFGCVPRRYSSRPCIWLHAVSLGEVNAAATLIAQLEQILPEYEIVISTTTDTGYNRATSLYSQSHRVFFYPWDFSFAVRSAFNRIRPSLCILMELELWHNFSAIAQKRSIPLAIANGRISSAKGFPRYKKIAPFVKPMFRRLSLVLAQDTTYADRFKFLGTPSDRIKTVGTLKYDTADVSDTVDGADELAKRLNLDPKIPLIVAGSTGPHEEDIILDAFTQLHKEFSSPVRLAIIPRKPERFDEVAKCIESAGYKLIRFSTLKSSNQQASDDSHDAVILGDTMGDLRKFYSLAAIIFVGRSLVPMGGSDMIEAAALKKPILLGPHTENFEEAVSKLKNAHAVRIVRDAADLKRDFLDVLADPAKANELAERARNVILENQGATMKSVEAIADLLGYQMPLHPSDIATQTS